MAVAGSRSPWWFQAPFPSLFRGVFCSPLPLPQGFVALCAAVQCLSRGCIGVRSACVPTPAAGRGMSEKKRDCVEARPDLASSWSSNCLLFCPLLLGVLEPRVGWEGRTWHIYLVSSGSLAPVCLRFWLSMQTRPPRPTLLEVLVALRTTNDVDIGGPQGVRENRCIHLGIIIVETSLRYSGNSYEVACFEASTNKHRVGMKEGLRGLICCECRLE